MPSVRKRAERRNVTAIVVVVAVVLILGIVATFMTRSSDSDDPEADDLAAAVERREANDPTAIGPVDAPVTVVMFSDFQCAYCALWTEQTLPAVREYVDEGQVRVEWRDLAIYGDLSDQAARAAYAAGLQGKYVEFNEKLFSEGEIPDDLSLSEPGLIGLAGELGLDVDEFSEAMRSDVVAEAVTANQQEALELGVRATPSFLVGGSPVTGAQPTDQFVAGLEQALAEAG